jgi:hypothetical protein
VTGAVASLLVQLSWLVAAAALVAGAGAFLTTRSLLPSLGLFLDFLLAAGLLRLATAGTWQAIAAAAVIVAIRKLAVLGLRSTGGFHPGGPPTGGGAPVRPAGQRS